MRYLIPLLTLSLLTACDNQPPDSPSTAGRTIDQYEQDQAATQPPGVRRYGIADPLPKPPGAIRLATYNVENLFDAIDDPALSGDLEDIDDTKPPSEIEALAATIRRLDADILCLQEIENESVLLQLRDAYLADMGYDHVLSPDAGDPRGIDQGVLSRFPITGHEQWIEAPLGGVHPDLFGDQPNWYAGQPITFKRSPIRIDIEIPADVTGADAYELSLYVVHLKSGRYNDYWREAEATKLVEHIQAQREADPTRNIAVLGDFNATADQRPVQIFLETGLIDTLASTGESGSVTHESGRHIDYILISPTLAHELVAGSPFVLGTPARPAGADWRSPPPPGYASDHYPVALDLVAHDE